MGQAFFKVGARAADRGLLDPSGEVLGSLEKRWHEPAWLSVLVGSQVLTVAAVANHGFSYLPARVGASTPAWCSGPGRALTLDHDETTLEALFEGETFVGGGPQSARSAHDLHSRNRGTAPAGVVVARGEYEHDVVEVCAPVRLNRTGEIVAALSVAVPAFRLGARATAIGKTVAEGAQFIGLQATRAEPTA
jgi:DNA-binding IclR family transcriptional regulator